MDIAARFTHHLGSEFRGIADVLNYGNSESFQRLWSGEAFAAERPLLIVWSDTEFELPAQRQLLKGHLTPLDWALAYSIKAAADRTQLSGIHIIDLSHTNELHWAVRMRHQLLALMPWVTLHSSVVLKDDFRRAGYRSLLGDETSGSLFVQSPGPIRLHRSRPAVPSQDRAQELLEIARQWLASLVQSRDHHDLNNLVGPPVVSDYVPADLLGEAFVQRMKWLDWCGIDVQRLRSISGWRPRREANQQGEPVNVYVVDDQLAGWGRFVCRMFGDLNFDGTALGHEKFVRVDTGEHEVACRVHGCLGPAPLVKFLECAEFRKRNYRQQLGAAGMAELIVLDLRLHSDTMAHREHARALLAIVSERATAGSLAWPAFEHEELRKIQEWVDGKGEDPDAADCASLLLPRLVALALPLTPIYLFSTTGQVWIREKLKPYRNIVSIFEKPRLLSDPQAAENSLLRLRDSLEQSTALMRLRLSLAHAQTAGDLASDHRDRLGDSLSKEHIEVYADESGIPEQGITSGLAVCIYKDRTQADEVNRWLRQCHREHRGWTGKKPDENNLIPPGVLLKGEQAAKTSARSHQQAVALAGEFLEAPELGDLGLDRNERRLWSVVATRVPAIRMDTDEISLATFPDVPMDTALRANLEFALYVLIPYFTANARFEGSVDIYLASRRVLAKSADAASRLCSAFDLGEPQDKRMVETATSLRIVAKNGAIHCLGTAFPLVRGWLEEWRSPYVTTRSVQRVKTQVLQETARNERSEEGPAAQRYLHDVADWACTASKEPTLRNALAAAGVFNHWFVGTDKKLVEGAEDLEVRRYGVDSENARVLLAALKAFYRADRANAPLHLLLQNSYVATCDRRMLESPHCMQQRIALWALSPYLESAGGVLLHSLLPS